MKALLLTLWLLPTLVAQISVEEFLSEIDKQKPSVVLSQAERVQFNEILKRALGDSSDIQATLQRQISSSAPGRAKIVALWMLQTISLLKPDIDELRKSESSFTSLVNHPAMPDERQLAASILEALAIREKLSQDAIGALVNTINNQEVTDREAIQILHTLRVMPGKQAMSGASNIMRRDGPELEARLAALEFFSSRITEVGEMDSVIDLLASKHAPVREAVARIAAQRRFGLTTAQKRRMRTAAEKEADERVSAMLNEAAR